MIFKRFGLAAAVCTGLLGLAVRGTAAPEAGGKDNAKSFAAEVPGGVVDDRLLAESGGGERVLACPPSGQPEGEANCGVPTDNFNGGCNSAIPRFQIVSCGTTICGTAAFNGAVRDTDWYSITLGSKQNVTLTVTADFKAVVGFISGLNGTVNCGQATGVAPFAIVQPGQTQSVTKCLNPGTWLMYVAPDTDQPVQACGVRYNAVITCETPCPQGACCLGTGLMCQETQGVAACLALGGRYQGDGTECPTQSCEPPPNDTCATAATIVCNATYFADTRNATLSPGETLPNCVDNAGVGSVWYKLTGTGNPVGITTCDSASLDPNALDSIIAVYIGNCGALSNVTCNDDAGCGPLLLNSTVCFNTALGSTYFIQVLPYQASNRGEYKLDVTCPCTTTVSGSCCFPNGVCASMSRTVCVQNNGVYQGDGASCATTTCPDLPPPLNDDCFSAPFLAPGGTTPGYTLFALSDDDGSLPSCGPAPSGPGVWYRVSGNGRRLTASLCNSGTDYDSRLLIFCGDCEQGNLACVAGNDDGGGTCGAASTASWCSQSGQTYSILVTGGSGSSGQFALALSTESALCNNPAGCDPNCAVTCPQGGIAEGEPECGTGYLDQFNGGCPIEGNFHRPISCGQTVCGKSGTFATGPGGTTLSRDTDWFRFTLMQQSVVTWKVRAEFPAQAFILNDDCGDIFAYAGESGNACQDLFAVATLEPGTYNVFVSPQFFTGVDCGVDWRGTLTCVATAANGACCLSTCSCTVTSETECLIDLGGIFYAGNGTTCQQTQCNPCPWDITRDGVTNTSDLVVLLLYFGQTSPLLGDITCDGVCNTSDLTQLLVQFGRGCP